MTLLSAEGVTAGYGGGEVLDDVSLSVTEGSLTALLGANGAGKTTTLRVVAGLLEPTAGTVRLDGAEIAGLPPHQIAARGVQLVPEDRGVFPDLSVDENLRVPVTDSERSRAELYRTFPELDDRRDAKGAHLSGGQQQLLAVARALRSEPRCLLLDEPFEGLTPPAVERLADVVGTVVSSGTGVVLVEQNAGVALELADRATLLDGGEVVLSGTPADLRERDRDVRRRLGPGDPRE